MELEKGIHKLPTEREARSLIHSAHRLFSHENNILQLSGDISVVGDVDGNIDDAIRIITEEKKNGSNILLFFGNLLSRGEQCLAVILHLLRGKVRNPSEVYIIRDARFSALAQSCCSIKLNCIETYSEKLYDELVKCLEAMPLAAVLNQSVYATHGGVPCYRNDNKVYLDTKESDFIASIEVLQELSRDLTLNGSDPLSCLFRRKSKDSERLLSYSFSKNIASEFLIANGLKSVLGCHEYWENFTKELNDGSQEAIISSIYTDTILDGPSVSPTKVARLFENGAPESDENNQRERIQVVEYPMPDKVKDYVLPAGKTIFHVLLPLVTQGATDLGHYLNVLKQKVIIEHVKDGMQTPYGVGSETKLAPNPVKEMFSMLDHGSGILTCDSFLKYHARSEIDPIVNLLIQAFQTTHFRPGINLEYMEFNEFCNCILSEDRCVRTKLLFRFFDIDKDDKISADDLMNVLTSLDSDELLKMSLKSAYLIACRTVRQFGSSGVISRGEFRRAVKDLSY